MTKETKDLIDQKTKELLEAPSCCAELKEAANRYLNASSEDEKAAALKAYIAELEADVTPIDGLIAFAGSERGRAVFGEETAAAMSAKAIAAKQAGEKYCICDACQAGAAILSKKTEILGLA